MITIHHFLAPTMLASVLATSGASICSELHSKNGGKIGGSIGGFIGGALGATVVSGPIGILISGVGCAVLGLGIGHGIDKLKSEDCAF